MIPVNSILLLLILFSSCKEHCVLKDVKKFPGYPSASGIEYFNKQLFVIGADANELLVLDSNLVAIDSIFLYSFPGKRIPLNAGVKTITLTKDNQLLLLGSGSFSPYGTIAWLIDPVSKQKDSIRLDTFYQRLKNHGLDKINIDGVCSIPGYLVLANGGNKGWHKNHLIITKEGFWKDQWRSPISLIHVGANTDSTVFSSVSGLAYATKSDELLLTVSTKDTRSHKIDSGSGNSYLWIIKGISSKRTWKAINPNEIIDLEEIDQRFKSQKINSVCVTAETKGFLHLALASDNADGSSTIFRMLIEKN